MKKSLFVFLLFPSLAFCATLKDDSYELDITYRKEQKETEPRKLHLKLNSSSFQPLHFFYSKDKKEDPSQFIKVDVQDIRFLTFVGSETDTLFLEAVIVSDQGAVLMGYVEAESSFVISDINPLGPLTSIAEVVFFTDEEKDKKDSTNYGLEYAQEYLWKGIQESDFVRYHVSETRQVKSSEDPQNKEVHSVPYEYEMIQRVVKIKQDSVEVEIITPDTSEPIRKTISWKEYPSFKVKKVLPFKKTLLESVTVRDLAQRKSIAIQTFEFEIENEKGERLTLSLTPFLFPLVYFNGINASVQAKNSQGESVQTVVEVNRFKFDQGKEELARLTPEQQEILVAQVRGYSSEFFKALKNNQLTKETIDQFIAMDELFIALDGFPQSFESEKTLEDVISDMERTLEERFRHLDRDMNFCLEHLSNIDHDLALLNSRLAQDPNDIEAKRKRAQLTFLKREWEQKREMLERLKATDCERLKEEERRFYTEKFRLEQQSRRNVLAHEITELFQREIPAGVTLEQVMQIGKFALLSPTRALISFPTSSVKLHLKRYEDSHWKICAIVR